MIFKYKLVGLIIVFKNSLIIFFILLFIELIGQGYAWFNPGFENLKMEPSKIFGWTYPPNQEFTYTGGGWYAREFSIKNKINSLGFRDLERNYKKPNGIIRVALLGASLIAGKESEFKYTIGQILERKLNKKLKGRLGKHFEVLNFGVDGYGLGQPLVLYEEVVKNFNPDFVFLYFADELLIWKTANPNQCWFLEFEFGSEIKNMEKENKCYNLRPVLWFNEIAMQKLFKSFSFHWFNSFILKLEQRVLEHGFISKASGPFYGSIKEYNELISSYSNFIKINDIRKLSDHLKNVTLYMKPPKQINLYSKEREKLKEIIFNGKSFKKKEKRFFLRFHFEELKKNINNFQKRLQNPIFEELNILENKFKHKDITRRWWGNDEFPSFEITLFVNLKILQNFNQMADRLDSRFFIADGTQFHTNRSSRLTSKIISSYLEKFADVEGFGYIPLSNDLLAAKKNGLKLNWKHDPHFSPAGNEVVAEGIYKWLVKEILNN